MSPKSRPRLRNTMKPTRTRSPKQSFAYRISSRLPFRSGIELFNPEPLNVFEVLNVMNCLNVSNSYLIQQILMRLQPDNPIFFRIADNPDRIASPLHRLAGFFIKPAQKDHASIRVSQMFGCPVKDRPLAFLRHPILITSGEPADRLIPSVDAKLALL